MPTIGTRAHAAIALDLAYGARVSRDWKRIGNGSMRSVFLHIATGVVYKVERYAEDKYDNESEYRNAKRLARRKWESVYIPKVSLFRLGGGPVLAMEYVEGTLGSQVPRDFNPEARREIYMRARFVDMHGDNFIFRDSDDALVPVDMGSPTLRSLNSLYNGAWEADRRVLSCGDGDCWGLE